MNKPEQRYKQAYEREKKIRLKAEQLLEDKSRELFLKHQELEASYKRLQQQQSIMLNNEKLATLGTLSAGVAHEINNPLAFVISNIETLNQYLDAYQQLYALCRSHTEQKTALPPEQLAQQLAESDLEYIQEDLPELMQDTQEGLQRVREIILNLRSFSRHQSSDRVDADLLEGIQSTIKLLSNELKNNISLELNLQPLPAFNCNPNEINQIFLNLILNAKHACEEIRGGLIKISSEVDNNTIQIRISDNGCGMSEAVQKEMFVPFFTTKPVGKGTGMGLAIVFGIVKDHNGEISVESEPGKGTTFVIRFPIPA